ncbi:outer membrane protein OmpA-like peptidoglycan-associated protein [Novosphingobium chloroacetimidivorans]|uniref:Outer membrane protein OmpA-like peptidoglycan-associated protein n=1 Tax=Novosphingobium chloroacetimidivorans TaxID=1428314 RepID=A0A7W7KAT0_9SPHN|nr:OmpA family protein [Novosphingobium chloroacetimidivorans]MBB4859155.1 outer membrane protein OmpA-like peptidoglycan-associated protein [Novosphingobium chloroacetimidivorans]
MRFISHSRKALMIAALLAGTATALNAQAQDPGDAGVTGSVTDTTVPDPAAMTKGPEIEGIISARSGDRMQVTAQDGTKSVVTINDATKIKAAGGFLNLNRSKLAATSLLNGLPVTVKTLQGNGVLLATQVDLKNKDLKTATMIHNGTDQRFAEQSAATEALRGRMGDIDQYNVKSTTNVNFDTGKSNLSEQAKADLCNAAKTAESMDNALLLVVGYTDSVGSEEYNQELSDKRAGRVVNYLQQACKWKPYRMLTPTGMAEADPMADNSTEEGKAQNRRVTVNVLVSKGLDGL